MKAEFKRFINRGIALGLMALMACVNPLQTLSPSNEGAVVKAAGKDALLWSTLFVTFMANFLCSISCLEWSAISVE